nr:hypothetical protein CPAG_02383 [Coccidioides posadasii RMSCC 3488]
MLEVDPANFAPHLSAFQHDSGHPSAILIGYLPHSTPMNCVTYSKERMDKAIKGIEQIHSAFIEHIDPYTKNILIVPGSERVLWIDFDVAITYPNSTFIGERERCWIKEETECVKGFGVKRALLSFSRNFSMSNKLNRQAIKRRISSQIRNITRYNPSWPKVPLNSPNRMVKLPGPSAFHGINGATSRLPFPSSLLIGTNSASVKTKLYRASCCFM